MMINTIEALQGLYVALGGDITDVANVTTIPEMLTAIATVAGGGGGSSLPAVTTDDNNKLLTVVEGEWNKADAVKELPEVTADDIGDVLTVVSDGESGAVWGKGALPTPEQTTVLYKGTFNGSNFNLSDNKTLGDIKTDLAAGKVVVLGIVNNNTADVYQNKYFYLSTGAYKVQSSTYPHFQWSFIAYDQTNDVYHYEYIYIHRGSADTTATFSYTNTNLPFLPNVSASDNDKILKVVNGVWTAVTP